MRASFFIFLLIGISFAVENEHDNDVVDQAIGSKIFWCVSFDWNLLFLDEDKFYISYETLEEFENLTHNKPFPTDFEREKPWKSTGVATTITIKLSQCFSNGALQEFLKHWKLLGVFSKLATFYTIWLFCLLLECFGAPRYLLN